MGISSIDLECTQTWDEEFETIFINNCRCEIVVAFEGNIEPFKRNMGIIRFSYTRLAVKFSLLVEQAMSASRCQPAVSCLAEALSTASRRIGHAAKP